MKRIAKRKFSETEIPTASQGDIAFLLIIFFMIGTTFRGSQGLKVVLPNAQSTERILKKKNTESMWIDKTGRVSVSDNLVTIPTVTPIMSEKVIENPDLVLMDVRMPVMTGFEACRLIKNDPNLKDIPVVFLSAKGQESEIQTGLQAGAVEYLLKPFAPDELAVRIADILARSAKQAD